MQTDRASFIFLIKARVRNANIYMYILSNFRNKYFFPLKKQKYIFYQF